MKLEWAGVLLALATFATIGLGHILVRRFHARFGTRPGIPLLVLGLLVFLSSAIPSSNLAAGLLGITGITVIWDGIEIFRQEKRMQAERPG